VEKPKATTATSGSSLSLVEMGAEAEQAEAEQAEAEQTEAGAGRRSFRTHAERAKIFEEMLGMILVLEVRARGARPGLFEQMDMGMDFFEQMTGMDFFEQMTGMNFFEQMVGMDFFEQMTGMNFFEQMTGMNFFEQMVGMDFFEQMVGMDFFEEMIKKLNPCDRSSLLSTMRVQTFLRNKY
jgi:hypothetical protein